MKIMHSCFGKPWLWVLNEAHESLFLLIAVDDAPGVCCLVALRAVTCQAWTFLSPTLTPPGAAR